jgi:hypothetical protein
VAYGNKSIPCYSFLIIEKQNKGVNTMWLVRLFKGMSTHVQTFTTRDVAELYFASCELNAEYESKELIDLSGKKEKIVTFEVAIAIEL